MRLKALGSSTQCNVVHTIKGYRYDGLTSSEIVRRNSEEGPRNCKRKRLRNDVPM